MKKLIAIIALTLLTWVPDKASSSSKASALVVPPLSVQLWSVRDFVKKDFNGTLKQLSALGFKGVEFAGDYGPYENNPAKLKALLDSLGLKVSGVHVSFADLKPQNLHKNLLFYKVIGAKYVIVPWDERAWSSDGVDKLVKELNDLVEPLANYGMQIGFHNHDKEFNSFRNETYWDHIAKNTSPQVLLQLDVGWVNFAGKDAIEYVKKYSGRTLTTHYKIRTRKDDKRSPIIGANGYPWAELLKANVDFGGTQWIVVEQEEYPLGMTSLKAVAESKAGIEKIIQDLNFN